MIEINGYPPTKTIPWKHQIDGWNRAKQHTEFLLGDDMGAGKTKTAIDFCNGVDANLILVVCPSAVVGDVWPGEFKTHSFKDYRIVALNDTGVKKKAKKLEQEIRFSIASKRPLCVVINFESIWREPLGPSYNMYNKLISKGIISRQPWDVIIVDESQKIASYKSTVSKFMHDIGKSAKYRLCLSGTFMNDKPMDVFGQFRFMDDAIFGKTITGFKNKYVEEVSLTNASGKSFPKITGYKNIQEFNEKVNSRSRRVLKRDVVDLPPVTHVNLYCDLSKKAQALYESFRDDLVVEVTGGILSTQTIVVKLMRLAQMAGGYLPLEDPDGVVRSHGEVIDNSKLDLLDYIYNSVSIEEPIVIFCRFTNELQRIKEFTLSKGRTCAELSGSMNQLAEWKDGKFNVIAVQIKSGAAGISLVRSCIGVYYSKGYSLGEFNQSLARQDRPGQIRSVTFYHLIAKFTMDQVIELAIKGKEDIIKYVLNYHNTPNKPQQIKVA